MDFRSAGGNTINPVPEGKKTSSPGLARWLGLYQSRTYLFFSMLVLTLLSGLAVVDSTHENRVAFNELQELREQANRLDVQWGQLLLEQSTFGVEGRIEQKAIEQLAMKVPEISNIVMVTSHE